MDYFTPANAKHDCLAYTFGIANEWDFEDYAGGDLECEVHAFDPTTSYKAIHEQHQVPNVQFHYQGLASPTGTAAHGDASKGFGYGALGGEMKTLGELWHELGHAAQNRPISLLKIDCEGCEWYVTLYIFSKRQDDNRLTSLPLIIVGNPSTGLRHTSRKHSPTYVQ
jgi:hypothetical protein